MHCILAFHSAQSCTFGSRVLPRKFDCYCPPPSLMSRSILKLQTWTGTHIHRPTPHCVHLTLFHISSTHPLETVWPAHPVFCLTCAIKVLAGVVPLRIVRICFLTLAWLLIIVSYQLALFTWCCSSPTPGCVCMCACMPRI